MSNSNGAQVTTHTKLLAIVQLQFSPAGRERLADTPFLETTKLRLHVPHRFHTPHRFHAKKRYQYVCLECMRRREAEMQPVSRIERCWRDRRRLLPSLMALRHDQCVQQA